MFPLIAHYSIFNQILIKKNNTKLYNGQILCPKSLQNVIFGDFFKIERVLQNHLHVLVNRAYFSVKKLIESMFITK